jgi:hypothetical protein
MTLTSSQSSETDGRGKEEENVACLYVHICVQTVVRLVIISPAIIIMQQHKASVLKEMSKFLFSLTPRVKATDHR